jgi:ADP-ribosyl-[dinitrogen reductase] hydrolase
VYGALVARDFTHGVLIAVNHSGDCDSTAAITGSLLGTMLGVGAIPDAWLAELEVRDEVERLAAEWIARFA